MNVKMNMNRFSRGLALALAANMLAGSALASSVYVRRNTVVPVVSEGDLSIKNNRRGDRFFVRIEEDRDLPRGARIEGRVLDVQPKRNDRPAYMDLEFTTLHLP
ncbi:MAG TPA: hypothetical protein VEX38_09575, partial [Fimbriimonadaceae bacterium]|nr:hypothetical protein [Fimbriimonadaceae bacterium]